MRSTEVGLPHLEPGQEGTVMITFVAPLDIGEYYSVWRASNNERNFGSKIWCKIKVVGEIVPSGWLQFLYMKGARHVLL